MSYEVLARKWRPQIFQDVIGQEHTTQTLINAIKTGRLAHAYLFSGARGVGKTSVARILAKAINCQEGEPGVPCNQCHVCQEITAGSSVDVQEIDGASNRGIDEIRELRENIKYMPASSKFRIYIIDEVHMLTKEAFNALLKTLEEPPPHVKFFFATTEPHKVPVTILSRCQRFDFKRIPVIKIVKQLEKVTGEEGIEISKSGLTLIAREAEGSMRDAESLVDQVVSYKGTKIDDKDISEILGIIDRDLIFETSLAIIQGDSKKCIKNIDRIYNYGYDIKEFYRALMDQFRNLLVILITDDDHLFDMTGSDMEETRRQAKLAGKEKLHQVLNILIPFEEDLRYSSHPKLVLETVIIKLCRLGDILSFDELIRRIEILEERLSSSFTSENRQSVPRLSDPGLTWKTEEEKNEVPEKIEDEPDRQEWDRFLKYLSSKNKAMSNVLKEWHLLSLTNDVIEIAKSNNSFSSGYLDDPQRLKRLKEYCTDFFKREIKVNILTGVWTDDKKKDPVDDRRMNSDAGKKADLPPPVQDVLQIFKGEIREEIPKKGGDL